MKVLLDKLGAIARETAAAKGEFTFFALLLREDAPDRWDLVVAAPWIDKDSMGATKYLADCLGQALDAEEILRISRIVHLEAGTPFLDEISQKLITGPGFRGVLNVNGVVAGISIKQMYIFESRQPAPSRRKRNGREAGSAKPSGADR